MESAPSFNANPVIRLCDQIDVHALEDDACGFKHNAFYNQPFWLRDKAEAD